MRNRMQGTFTGLFMLLGLWCLMGIPPAAVAATTPQGQISGKVTDKSTGAGVAGVTVTASLSSVCASSQGSATTISDGTYVITGLAAGAYQVDFAPPQSAPFYVPQWFNGVLNQASATPVTVADPGTTPNINAVLERGGTISGTISTSNSLPPLFVTVTATGATKGAVASTTTDFMNPGPYTITGLPSDTYTVTFTNSFALPSNPQYARQNYPSPVAVTAPGTTGNVNITLSPGGSISGTVTDTGSVPLANIMVFAQLAGATEPSGFGSTDATGAFSIGGLQNGTTYEVTYLGMTTGYIQDKKTGIAVTAPLETNIGAKQLRLGGQIQGTVVNYAGSPLQNVYVVAHDAATGAYVNATTTQASGAYTINALDTRTYKVQFSTCQGGYAEQWYNLKATQAAADPISLTAPAIRTGIDGKLNLQSSGFGVTYNGNGSTGGTVPVDSATYLQGATVTVKGNTGALVKTGSTFSGWNTAANGSGTSYAAGATFAMGSANVTLYAQWTAQPTHTVTYNGNGSTGGTVPSDNGSYPQGGAVTVLGNTGILVKTGATFSGWNTAANGSGVSYAGGATFAMGSANVTLYAVWTPLPTYAVTYNGNGSTGGAAPVDGAAYLQGATVTVLDNTGALVKTGFTFNGWNSAADGSGTNYAAGATFVMGNANVTLYAKWTATSGTVKGDINGDTKVDVFDALLTLQYSVGLIPHTPENDAKYLAYADVAPLNINTGKPQGDGKVDVFDALAILRHAVNLDPW